MVLYSQPDLEPRPTFEPQTTLTVVDFLAATGNQAYSNTVAPSVQPQDKGWVIAKKKKKKGKGKGTTTNKKKAPKAPPPSTICALLSPAKYSQTGSSSSSSSSTSQSYSQATSKTQASTLSKEDEADPDFLKAEFD
jgi:hypothetical protein